MISGPPDLVFFSCWGASRAWDRPPEIAALPTELLVVASEDSNLGHSIPLLRVRRRIRTADGHALAAAGFALLPTWEYPHWSVVVPDPTPKRFAQVRALFSDPILNPAYQPGRS